MNHSEAEKFTDELIIAFPAFKAVAEKHSPNFERTKDAWRVAWIDLTISECRGAIKSLLVEGGITYENLQQPGPFIRRLVMDARKAGNQSERDRVAGMERDHNANRKRDFTGQPMAKALADALSLHKLGTPKAEIAKAIAAAMPSMPYDGPSFRCTACFDSGRVFVVKTPIAHDVASGKRTADSANRSHCYPVACSCGAGELFRNARPGAQGGEAPVYDPANFCVFRDDDNDAERIIDWLANRKPRNYESSFDKYGATA
jgi:hypothetical protein